MGHVAVTRDVLGSIEMVEALWYEPSRWRAWIDGFGSVVELSGNWPRSGAHLVWESRPGGRGRVSERVLGHRDGAGQELEVSDGRLTGRQSVAFEALEGGVSLRLSLDYRLRDPGPLTRVLDPLFIRRAMRDSLRRTLERFDGELAADRELLR